MPAQQPPALTRTVTVERNFDAPRDLVYQAFTNPFEEHGRGTRLVATTMFASQVDRDGMVQSGMERGSTIMFDRLEEHLAAA